MLCRRGMVSRPCCTRNYPGLLKETARKAAEEGEYANRQRPAVRSAGDRQQLELSIQKRRDLINLAGIPTFMMPGSATRCARKSSLNATWQKYAQAAQPRAVTALSGCKYPHRD